MISFDHIAITVNDLEKSIIFYTDLGYKLVNQFLDKEYKWATLALGDISLELFEPLVKGLPQIEHLAYSFTDEEEVFDFANRKGFQKEDLDIFFGDLNRKSFFIEDDNGKSIQFIKKV